MSNLLVGLPDDLVVEEILPRLPWYTRPVCRAASKHWRAAVDTTASSAKLQLTTQTHQFPLLNNSTLIFSSDNQNQLQLLLIKDEELIRPLPPVRLFSGKPRLVFWSGMVYVWTLAGWKCWDGGRDRIFKLDLGRAQWKWESFPVGYISAWFDEICYRCKIYAAWNYRHSAFGGRSVRLNVHVYDMNTDTCERIEKWPYACVGVSWDGLNHGRSSSSEKVAGFTGSDNDLWDLLTYDGGRWERQAVIPGEGRYPHGVKFVRGDCFVPALAEGFNVVILNRDYTSNKECVKWYNTKCSGGWATVEDVESGFSGDIKLKSLKVVNGWLYGLGENESQKRWYVYHGKIDTSLHASKVVWEVFLELESPIECWAMSN